MSKRSEDGLTSEEDPKDGSKSSASARALEDLVRHGDTEGLIELGSRYRRGKGVSQDLARALACFEAAADCGSPGAEYVAAVSHMTGVGTHVSFESGVSRLRSAARGGNLRAKVYLANLYELGVHYDQSSEKADSWYRDVARTAGIDGSPTSPEYELEMAALGCVRQCLKIARDDTLPAKKRSAFLRKAKALGYGLTLRTTKRRTGASPKFDPEESRELDAAIEEANDAILRHRPPDPDPESLARPPERETEGAPPFLRDRGSRWTLRAGLASSAVATFFVSVGLGVGWLAAEGVRGYAARGEAAPLLSNAPWVATLWATLLAVGVLPTTAVYRARAVALGALLGVSAGAGAFYGFPSFGWTRDAIKQGTLVGAFVFLATLLFLGLVGGSRLRFSQEPPRP